MGLRIVILGAPGAGKGTQARRLASRRRLPHISTGDIFRRHLTEDTAFSRKIRPYMESGALVPDELTCAIVEERLAGLDCDSGYVLDGFPRSLAQAETLDLLLEKRGERLDAAICLVVPDDEIVARLSARRTCPVCGTIYNLKFDPPKGDPARCARNGCAGVLVQRPDDNEETIRQRLVVYHQMTEPIEAFYQERGLLKPVPGDIAPDDVSAKIEEILCALEMVQEP